MNIRCLAISKRLLENYVDKHKVDIVVLSETWNRENCIKFKNWINVAFKNRTGGYGGVAIFAKPGVKIVPRIDFDKYDIEICWGQLKVDNKIITIASCYIPPGDTPSLINYSAT